MARLRREHHRMLGNGYCTRPAELDCAFESICQTCTFFQTSIEFRPTPQAQHDDAIARHQDLSVTDRAATDPWTLATGSPLWRQQRLRYATGR
jgi:hypothetical protein